MARGSLEHGRQRRQSLEVSGQRQGAAVAGSEGGGDGELREDEKNLTKGLVQTEGDRRDGVTGR